MSGTMMEDEDLLRAAEYALSIVRRTEELAATQGVDSEYQSALTSLTGYVAALQAASMSSRRPPNPLQGPEPTPSRHPQARTLSMEVLMPPQEPRGPFCQSCAMPLRAPEDFGTDQAGFANAGSCVSRSLDQATRQQGAVATYFEAYLRAGWRQFQFGRLLRLERRDELGLAHAGQPLAAPGTQGLGDLFEQQHAGDQRAPRKVARQARVAGREGKSGVVAVGAHGARFLPRISWGQRSASRCNKSCRPRCGRCRKCQRRKRYSRANTSAINR